LKGMKIMKIKTDYSLRKVAGEYIVVPLAEESKRVHGIFNINEVGAKLFELYQNGAESADGVKLLMDTYGIDEATATADNNDFVELLKKYELLED
ncbi:MAG: PqqD family protein, partial [Oscillospiraceae bacterium]